MIKKVTLTITRNVRPNPIKDSPDWNEMLQIIPTTTFGFEGEDKPRALELTFPPQTSYSVKRFHVLLRKELRSMGRTDLRVLLKGNVLLVMSKPLPKKRKQRGMSPEAKNRLSIVHKALWAKMPPEKKEARLAKMFRHAPAPASA